MNAPPLQAEGKKILNNEMLVTSRQSLKHIRAQHSMDSFMKQVNEHLRW